MASTKNKNVSIHPEPLPDTPPRSALIELSPLATWLIRAGVIVGIPVLYTMIAIIAMNLDILTGTSAGQEPNVIIPTLVVGIITIIYALIARTFLLELLTNKWTEQQSKETLNKVQPQTLPSAILLSMMGVALIAWLAAQILARVVLVQFGSTGFNAVAEQMANAQPWAMITLAILIAPISEELLMRGVIYPALRLRSSVWVSAIITLLIFGIIHGNAVQFVITIPLTILTIWVYELSRNIGYCIIMHIVFNSMGVLVPLGWTAHIAENNVLFAVTLSIVLIILSLFMGNKVHGMYGTYRVHAQAHTQVQEQEQTPKTDSTTLEKPETHNR